MVYEYNINSCDSNITISNITDSEIKLIFKCNEYDLIKDIFGYIGGFGVVFTYLPQVIKAWKTGLVRDISIKYIIIGSIATLFMIAYSGWAMLLPILVVNPLILIEMMLMLAAKLYFEKCKKSIDQNNGETQDVQQPEYKDDPSIAEESV